MTISYSGNFCRLLLRWRGSVWKAVSKELFVFLILYYTIRIVYQVILDEARRSEFESVSLMFSDSLKSFPLTFLLGFYVSFVVGRWWKQFGLVAWPDDLLSLICFVFPNDEEGAQLKRHQIARYLCLTCALSWRDISVKVRQRFPSVEHLVKMGLMTEKELELYNRVAVENLRWWVPLQWVQNMVRRQSKEGKIPAPICSTILKEIQSYRLTFHQLYCYDWVCIPLVYTQVVSVATYGYFFFTLMGAQFLNPDKEYDHHRMDLFVPALTILQFVFYVGWFKVGQYLMHPFDTDDDDIELNYILDRHVQTCFAMVRDSFLDQEPPLTEDKFWSEDVAVLGHTRLSSKQREHPPILHAHVKIKDPEDAETIDQLPQPSGKKLRQKLRRHF